MDGNVLFPDPDTFHVEIHTYKNFGDFFLKMYTVGTQSAGNVGLEGVLHNAHDDGGLADSRVAAHHNAEMGGGIFEKN